MLQMNQKALEAYSAETIQNLVDRIAPILEYRREMYKRYSRKNGLYEIIGDDGQKKTVPFEYYIANMVTGYLSGKAPQYNVRCRNCGEGRTHASSNPLLTIFAATTTTGPRTWSLCGIMSS